MKDKKQNRKRKPSGKRKNSLRRKLGSPREREHTRVRKRCGPVPSLFPEWNRTFLADRVGLSTSSVCRILRGEANPTLEVAARLSGEMGISMEELRLALSGQAQPEATNANAVERTIEGTERNET